MGLENRMDLLILEDSTGVLKVISTLSEDFGINSIGFSSGLEAISYIENLEKGQLPLSYLVDMKINENISRDSLFEELASSEEIYWKLKSKNANLDLFTYMSGNCSNHDEGVLDRTGMFFIQKGVDFFKYLPEEFFPKIEKRKRIVYNI